MSDAPGGARDAGRELARASYVSLASFRRDGREVRTPVWIAGEAGRLYVYTNGRSGKVKRIRREPRVRLAPCDVRGRVDGAWVDATARVCESPEAARRGFEALRRKYGWQLRAVLFASRLGGRYADRTILEIRPEDGQAS